MERTQGHTAEATVAARDIIQRLVALVGRGLAEGAYKDTVSGNQYAESIMNGGQALVDSGSASTFAAAPDLLTMLTVAVNYLRKNNIDGQDLHVHEMEAAIAKAVGRAE